MNILLSHGCLVLVAVVTISSDRNVNKSRSLMFFTLMDMVLIPSHCEQLYCVFTK